MKQTQILAAHLSVSLLPARVSRICVQPHSLASRAETFSARTGYLFRARSFMLLE